MVIQIKDLLARQAEIDTSHRNTDARYKLISAQLAREAEKQNKPEEAKALRMLSSFGYNDYWKSMVESSQKHSLLPDQGDEYDRVHRNDTPIESAWLVPKNGHCDCDSHLELESMCRHKYVRGGRKFDAALFPEQLLQLHKMKPVDQGSAPLQVAKENFSDDGGGDWLCASDGGDVKVGKEAIMSIDNTALALSAPAYARSRHQKAVGHADLIREAMQVATYASNARPQTRDAVYESLIMMKEMLQGSSQDSPSNVVETLKNAMGSSTMTASLGEPKASAGPEANKQGAPWQSRLVSTTMI
jgi:hypothetical protein